MKELPLTSLGLHPRLVETAKVHEPLSRHCTLRIGGPAQVWLEPHNIEELQSIVSAAHQHHISISIVGLGSNTLFPDEGIEGFVVRMRGDLDGWTVIEEYEQGAKIRVGAGTINGQLVKKLLKQGYVDHEFLVLIPGTFGGSIVMNAGTKEQEVASILEEVTVLVPKDGGEAEVQRLTPEQIQMRYRHTDLPHGALVVDGVIRVKKGDVEHASERVQFDKQRRNKTQPYRYASVGSTFANPDGDYAGRLIEAAGLKGTCIGGACISDLHANFFINQENATAHDFLCLMALARVKVRQQFGVELRPEVWFVGFDGHEAMLKLEAQLENA